MSHQFFLSLLSIIAIITITLQTEGESFEKIFAELSNNTSNTSQEGFQPTKKLTVILNDTEIEIAPGKSVKVWAFNNTVPGPTLRFTEGERVSILFKNKKNICS